MRKEKHLSAKVESSKRHGKLTVAGLKNYRGLEDLTDDESKQAIEAIEKLCDTLFYMLKQHEINSYEDQREPLRN